MRAAAKLHGAIISDPHDADGIGVDLAEHGTHARYRLRVGQRHHHGSHRQTPRDGIPDVHLRGAQLGGAHRGLVTEIEPELLVVALTAALVASLPEDLAQCGVENVRHGVVGRHVPPAGVIHFAFDAGAGRDGSAGYHPRVEGVSAVGLHVADDELSPPLEGDCAEVGFLAAGLGVEGRLVQYQTHGIPLIDDIAILDETVRREYRLHDRIHLHVPGVLRRVVGDGDPAVGEPRRLLGDELQPLAPHAPRRQSRLPRPLFLTLHLGREALHVDGHSRLLGHQFRQVDGEAERVVQEEGLVGGHDLLLGGRPPPPPSAPLDFVLEVLYPTIEHRGEGLLLLHDNVDDVRLILDEFGIRLPEGVHDDCAGGGEGGA